MSSVYILMMLTELTYSSKPPAPVSCVVMTNNVTVGEKLEACFVLPIGCLYVCLCVCIRSFVSFSFYF